LDSKGILEALNASHLFSELTEAQMDRVRRHSHVTDMVEGESLFFQGDNATSFYLVLSGRIKLFRISPDGKEKVVEIMEAGATFAEALMFMDQPHYPVKFQGDAARIDRHLFSAARGNELPFTRTDS
jgi:CRP-like cAMP-binding protein